MVQGYLKTKFSPANVASIVQWLIVLAVLLFAAGPALCLDRKNDYFYLQEVSRESSGKSCADIFTEIVAGKEEDVGGLIKSLKSLNVHYLLEDYDIALYPGLRKNYLKLDDLRKEVAENKREIYCRIELAIYMKNNDSFRGPVYDELLNEVFLKLEKTYSSAMSSYRNEDFARAFYAFDLIAPYNDSDAMRLEVSNKFEGTAAENLAMLPGKTQSNLVAEAVEPADGAGPITLAAFTRPEMGTVETQPGAIALAAKLGPVTAAVKAMGVSGVSEEAKIKGAD